MALVEQLKQRRVIRAVIGYGIVAFALLQIIEPIMHGLHLPDATLTLLLVALALAFPVVVVASLALDIVGFKRPALAGERPGVPADAASRLGRRASLAVMLLAVAAVSAVVTLLAAGRRERSPTRPSKLTQVTFAGGIEEYPAWSPDGRDLLYVARVGEPRKVLRHDLRSGEIKQVTRGALDELQPVWSPDGGSLLVMRARQPGQTLQPGDPYGTFEEGDVWLVDLRTGEEQKLIANAFDPAWSPDGQRIAVDASWAGPRRIWVLDRDGHNPVQATTDRSEGVAHIAPRWSPDGKMIVFQTIERTKFDVRLVELDSKRMQSITDDAATDVRPVWSPSGAFIYFSSDRSGVLNLWRAPVRADGSLDGPLQQVTMGAGQDVEAAISPDGKQLAFSILRQNADIWRLPVSPATGLSTGAPEPVVSTTREDSRGAWSPDGKEIAFNSDRGGEMNIWVQTLATGAARQLTRGTGGDFQPNWSYDARKIVFFSSRSGTPDIWDVEVSSGKLRRLTSDPSVDVNPFYSPDGKKIAFQSDRSGRSEVWVMDADGRDARQLTRNGAAGHFMRWTDAGDAVIYRCRCGGESTTMLAPLSGAEPTPFSDSKGGSHLSLSPDRQRIMDVVFHRVLWVSPVGPGTPQKVFEFGDPNARIDYPVWSPDGHWVLFDRTYPQGGDIWVMRDFD